MDTQNPASIIKNWVELYSDSMFSWAVYKISSRETAEDLVQDTFLEAVHAFNKFEGKSSPKTWLFGILNNKINDHYRSKFRKGVIDTTISFEDLFNENDHWKVEERPQQWPNEEEHLLDNNEFRQTFQQCLDRLPVHWCSALHLKYIEREQSDAICQELGITVTNFWQVLHRAKLQMRKCLEVHWFRR